MVLQPARVVRIYSKSWNVVVCPKSLYGVVLSSLFFDVPYLEAEPADVSHRSAEVQPRTLRGLAGEQNKNIATEHHNAAGN